MSTAATILDQVDARTVELLEHRRTAKHMGRRGWLVRRSLLVADLVGLIAAFAIAELFFRSYGSSGNRFGDVAEVAIFLCTLPGWIVVAKLYGLYDRDEERTDHTTVED
ncbi:MAG: hypothetical protein ACRDPA_14035, partial [Solirubrobacteraceae bacterium]